MKIKEILYQNRRDFEALFECETCGHEVVRGGYDDENFHANVIPKIKCPKCGNVAIDYKPLQPKYPEGYCV